MTLNNFEPWPATSIRDGNAGNLTYILQVAGADADPCNTFEDILS